MSTAFTQLLEDLCRHLQISPVRSLESPVELVLDDLPLTLSLDRRGGDEEILIHAVLGTVPAARELEVYRVLLEANLFWSATADATLGVNADTREAILAYRFPVGDLTGAALAELCAGFHQVAHHWAAFIAATAEEDEPSQAPGFENGLIRG